MIKSILSIILLSLTLSVFSQGPINIGIKFGTNRSTMITNFDDVLNQNILTEDVNNYLAGAFFRINLGRLYLQPEAYFNTKGAMVQSLGNDQFAVPTSTTFNYQTIDVPALIGLKLINKPIFNIRVHGGPVFSYITANSFVSEISNFSTSDFNNHYVGWQLGAGVDVWFITIDARMENSINMMNSNSAYQIRNRVYLISAGIKLF